MIQARLQGMLTALADGASSDEFLDRVASQFRHSQTLNRKADSLEACNARRVAGIRQTIFRYLAEIGEVFLQITEANPGGFEDWFLANEGRLGFKLRVAYHCKKAATKVRELGFEGAFVAAMNKAEDKRESAPSMRVPLVVDEISPDRARALVERLKPIYSALLQKVGNVIAIGDQKAA